MTESSIESQILSTLELLHYCRRFEGALFAFSFQKAEHCAALLMDLRVLLAARIRQVLFCPADQKIIQSLASWSKSGDRFKVIEASDAEILSDTFTSVIGSVLATGQAVVVARKDTTSGGTADYSHDGRVFSVAAALGATKVFFPIEGSGLVVDGTLRGYPTNQQVREALSADVSLNLAREWVSFLIDHQEKHGIDVVLVQARRGAIFEEVFTHAGSGTLFTKEYPNVLRAATEEDVRDIMALLQPYVAEGWLKPVREEDLLATIRTFKVFSVNGQIVCAAALKDYGEFSELTKLCTLPRFQARGRAGELVRALLEEARQRGKRGVFALTVQTYVGDFFERLGFMAVERDALPEEWKRGYDFSRPSRAFLYPL